MNAVEVNACWVESIKKESKNRILYENFDFNPKNLVILTEKPHLSKAGFNVYANPEDEEREMDELKKKLTSLTAVPKNKYTFPLTANQEVGWDHQENLELFRPKQPYSKKMCPETKYADNYVTMTKRSPYANARMETQQPQNK
mmetsp:Transcript_7236/g.6351  ORF Transcript_7236/g.6351 Transcript_7236/m.6351 type:complete len:143 (+) Transcript_7236:51-479(+)